MWWFGLKVYSEQQGVLIKAPVLGPRHLHNNDKLKVTPPTLSTNHCPAGLQVGSQFLWRGRRSKRDFLLWMLPMLVGRRLALFSCVPCARTQIEYIMLARDGGDRCTCRPLIVKRAQQSLQRACPILRRRNADNFLPHELPFDC